MARARAAGTRRSAGRSANGAGSITARTLAGGSVVYDVYWSYRDDEGNRRRAAKRGFNTFREAEKHRRTVTATVDARLYVPPQQITVAEYLAEWLEGSRLKPQTLAGYRRKIRLQIVPAIGHIPLDELRALHLNKLYRQLELRGGARGGPLSLTTVREVHNILSSAYSDAVKAGLVVDSPTRRADPPTERECKAHRPEMRAWTAQELRAFLQANAGDHYHPVWQVAATTGLRRGEVLGLRWDDVDLDTGRLSVRRSLGYGLPTLADKGYTGTGTGIRTPYPRPRGGGVFDPATAGWNSYVNTVRAAVERSIAALKIGWRALRHVSLDPHRIGDITAGALVLHRHQHR